MKFLTLVFLQALLQLTNAGGVFYLDLSSSGSDLTKDGTPEHPFDDIEDAFLQSLELKEFSLVMAKSGKPEAQTFEINSDWTFEKKNITLQGATRDSARLKLASLVSGLKFIDCRLRFVNISFICEGTSNFAVNIEAGQVLWENGSFSGRLFVAGFAAFWKVTEAKLSGVEIRNAVIENNAALFLFRSVLALTITNFAISDSKISAESKALFMEATGLVQISGLTATGCIFSRSVLISLVNSPSATFLRLGGSSNILNEGSKFISAVGPDSGIHLEGSLFRNNSGGLNLSSASKQENNIFIWLRSKQATLVSNTFNENNYFYSLIMIIDASTLALLSNNIFLSNAAAFMLDLSGIAEIVIKNHSVSNSCREISPKGKWLYLEVFPFGAALSIVEFRTLSLSDIFVLNSNSFSVFAGVAIISKSAESRGEVSISNLVCENNAVFHLTYSPLFSSNCLYIDARNKVTISRFKVMLNSVTNLNGDNNRGGNNCLTAVNENTETFINEGIFLANRASCESVCINVLGTSFFLSNSSFEDNKNPDSPMIISNDAGALHLGAGEIHITATVIKNCSAFSGAAITFHNEGDKALQVMLIHNITIAFNSGESTSALQFHSSIDRLQFKMSSSLITENLVNFHAIVATFFSGVSGSLLQFYNITVQRNVGRSIGGCFFLASIFCRILFEESSFVSNALIGTPFLGGTVFLVYGGDREFFVDSVRCTFIRNTCTSRGPTVLVQYGSYTDRHSIFQENFAPTAGVMSFEITTIAKLINSTILGKMTENTGAIYLSNSAKLEVNSSRFRACGAKYQGGVITALGALLSLKIFNSEFAGNRGEFDGVILEAAISYVNQVIFYNCSFTNNSAGRALFTGITFDFKIELSSFANNSCPLLEIRQSLCIISGSRVTTFEAASETDFGAVLMKLISKSHLLISSSVFDNRKAAFCPSLVRAEESKITITGTEIKYINGSKQSYMIFCIGAAISISNSSIFEIRSGLLSLEISELSISNVRLSDSESMDSALIHLKNMQAVFFDKSFFSNCTSTKSQGSIFIQALQYRAFPVLISSSKFEKMEASTGGAIYASGVSISFFNSTFSENVARETFGGAIHLTCQNSLCEWSLSKCSFESNRAELGGGAIKYTGRLPSAVSDCYFNNNIASFGRDYLSFPSNFLFKFGDDDSQELLNCRNQSDACKIAEAVSGQVLGSIRFQIRDTFDQLYHDNKLSAKIEISVNSQSRVPNYLQGTTSVAALNGTFIFQGLTAIAKPGSTNFLYFHFNVPFIAEHMKSEGYLSLDASTQGTLATIEAYFRKCVLGEIEITTTNICFLCLEGTFSLNLKDQACNKCLRNSKCFGGSRLEVDRGHWRQDITSINIYDCEEPPFSCHGGFTNICAEGYTGILCSECDSGGANGKTLFFKKNKYECETCELWRGYFALLVIFLFFFLLAIVLIINRQDESASAPPSIGKILSTHLQYTYQATTQGSSMPESVKSMTTNVSTTISMEGLFNVLSCLKLYLPVSTYVLNLFVTLFSMFVIIFFLIIIWGIVGRIKHRPWSILKIKLVSSIVVITYFMHSRYVNFFVTNLSCRAYEGRLYLVENLGQECWTGEHMLFSIILTLPMVLFWMVLLPGIIFYLILRNRKAKVIRSQHVVRYFNVGFKDNLYYWEFVLLLEKYLIILIPLGINDPNSQAKMVLYALLMLLYLVIHVEVKPYSTKDINILQFLSFYACFISYLSCIGRSSISSETLKMFITVMFFSSHGGFYALWGLMYYRMVIKKRLETIKNKIKLRTNNFMKSANSNSIDSPTASPRRQASLTKVSKFSNMKF